MRHLTPNPPHGRRAEPWRRRLVSTLLYGRNVDRDRQGARAASGSPSSSSPSAIRSSPPGWCMFAAVPRQSRRAAAPCGATMRWRPRVPTSSTATARFWRPTCARPSLFARAAAHHRRRRGGRTADRGDARPRRHANCASGSAPSAASSGSSARSRRSSSSRSTGSAFPASASWPRTSASIRTAPRSRT